ncbi:unnamed protein product [Adineta ricciae]|uniref:Secreted protein n=1 Tax=Adineta ricciae TaxID=249248 RepID=A0A813PVW4_ADIRI|nr:unnamed protein product [Adineta ricciae]CAF0918795.1 unnamed protein product [Adineta ricciae]
MVSQTWLTLVLCFTVECNSDFYVSSRSQYDCLYYYTTHTGFITKTKYYFRSTTDVGLMPIADFVNTRDQNYTFHQLFYNCTPPWFGSRCQYSLESDEIEPSALATGQTCYVLLDCDRGEASLCRVPDYF